MWSGLLCSLVSKSSQAAGFYCPLGLSLDSLCPNFHLISGFSMRDVAIQGAIYELKAPGGKECGKLLKVLKFKAILPITGNDIGELVHHTC